MSKYARGGYIERPPSEDPPPFIRRGCDYAIPAAVARRHFARILQLLNKRAEDES